MKLPFYPQCGIMVNNCRSSTCQIQGGWFGGQAAPLDDHGDHHVNEYVGLHFVSVENTKHIDKHFKELTSLQG